MWTCKTMKTLAIMVALGIGSVWAAAGLAGAESVIDGVKLSADGLPEGWKLIGEYKVPPEQIKQFESKFAVPITEMLNQDFNVDGKKHLRINYMASSHDTYTKAIYKHMMEMVGFENIIVRKGLVAVEIISGAGDLKTQAVALLDLSSLQTRKLKADDAPEGWRLVREFFVTEEELKWFEEKFDAGLEEIINQVFIVGDHAVQINYIAGKTVRDAEAVYSKLESQVGRVNAVLKRDNIVMEVITPSEALKKQAPGILGRI